MENTARQLRRVKWALRLFVVSRKNESCNFCIYQYSKLAMWDDHRMGNMELANWDRHKQLESVCLPTSSTILQPDVSSLDFAWNTQTWFLPLREYRGIGAHVDVTDVSA